MLQGGAWNQCAAWCCMGEASRLCAKWHSTSALLAMCVCVQLLPLSQMIHIVGIIESARTRPCTWLCLLQQHETGTRLSNAAAELPQHRIDSTTSMRPTRRKGSCCMGTTRMAAGGVDAPPWLSQVQLSNICQHPGACALWEHVSYATKPWALPHQTIWARVSSSMCHCFGSNSSNPRTGKDGTVCCP